MNDWFLAAKCYFRTNQMHHNPRCPTQLSNPTAHPEMYSFMCQIKIFKAWAVFFLMLSVSLLTLVAKSQESNGRSLNPVSSGKRIALVIGNDKYQKVSPLQKAGNDATAMARELKAAGFEVLLHKDLNYRGMVKAVETFSNSITGGQTWRNTAPPMVSGQCAAGGH